MGEELAIAVNERLVWFLAVSFLVMLSLFFASAPPAPILPGHHHPTPDRDWFGSELEDVAPPNIEETVTISHSSQGRNLLEMSARQLIEEADTTHLATCQWTNSVEYIDYRQVTITSMPGNPFEMVFKAGTDDVVSYSIISTNQWEGREVRSVIDRLALVAKNRGTNVTMLDIGANIGFFSLSAAASKPSVPP
ncbi:hypothetical protein SmJEL517_g02710 [Synchytrium microbalum]|uniref:Methyltransferase FkbM domain-containing protein n=1 Tax=Synchytrium microbalum TaxID=1806994 RepID=A0A507CB24_9FUNG|nr:uncharacterized protein SmJEL517_g02710 [Synchytrium microbalum]TPX34735.1 hypothetical protein SmJEL517_g02710 [Synchytrium microbalum]